MNFSSVLYLLALECQAVVNSSEVSSGQFMSIPSPSWCFQSFLTDDFYNVVLLL